MMFLLGYVVPEFASMYESLDAELSLVHANLSWASACWCSDWWIVLLVVPALGPVVAGPQALRHPAFRAALR
jgi:general secretion pathway protein F